MEYIKYIKSYHDNSLTKALALKGSYSISKDRALLVTHTGSPSHPLAGSPTYEPPVPQPIELLQNFLWRLQIAN